MDEDLAAFARWLRKDYAIASVRKLRSDIATMAQWGPSPPASKRLGQRLQDYRWAWGRWTAFCDETGRRNALPEPSALERRPGRRRPTRLKPAVSIDDKSWQALRKRIKADATPAGRVLYVLVSSGLRIGDVLRVPEPLLRDALAREDGVGVLTVKGAKPVIFTVRDGSDAWAQLHAILEPGQRVAAAVSSVDDPQAGGASYQACRRRLKLHAGAVGLHERDVHLHRTRRTVAVSLFKAGVPIESISKVLQHDSIQTTRKYLDESMADVAGRALQRINR